VGVVKGDRLGRSGKLAKLPLTSALAYAWVVSVPRARDDFGAFQWDAGLLRAQCFPLRPDVTVEMVARWLLEWLEVGLILRYRDTDEVELGVFTNFQGEPWPRFHRYDLPPELHHKCYGRCAKSGMKILAKYRSINKNERLPEASQRQAGGKPNARGTLAKREREASQTRAFGNASVPSVLPSLPSSSPSVPTVPEERKNDLVALKRDDSLLDGAREVFQHWRLQTGHRRAVWTAQRGQVLLARLREEPGDLAAKMAGLKLAVDGAVRDPWFNGSERGRPFLDFDNIFRNKGRDRIEKLQRLAQAPERSRGDSRADRIDAKVRAGLKRANEAGLVREALGTGEHGEQGGDK